MPDDTGVQCRELVELVTDYLEGAINTHLRDQIEEHLRQCEGCVEYVEQMRTTTRLARNIHTAQLDPHLRDTLLTAFRTQHTT